MNSALRALRAVAKAPGVDVTLLPLEPDQHATEYFGHEETGSPEVWIDWISSSTPGAGRQVLARIVAEADRLNVVLRGMADDNGSKRLIALYEALGFRRDPAGGDCMERVPEPSLPRAVRQWMGDSVMTDSGLPGDEPLVVYHGTAQAFAVEKMRSSREGSLGAGCYFTRTPDHAEIYGQGTNVLRAHVRLANPYRYRMRDGIHMDVWGERLAVDLLGWRGAKPLIVDALNAGEGFDHRLTKALQAKGYDGIVGEYEGGTAEVVAFDASQIREALPDEQLRSWRDRFGAPRELDDMNETARERMRA